MSNKRFAHEKKRWLTPGLPDMTSSKKSVLPQTRIRGPGFCLETVREIFLGRVKRVPEIWEASFSRAPWREYFAARTIWKHSEDCQLEIDAALVLWRNGAKLEWNSGRIGRRWLTVPMFCFEFDL